MRGRRGQTKNVGYFVSFILAAYVIFFLIFFLINLNQGWQQALKTATSSVSEFTMTVLGPLFSFLLNLGTDSSVNFLMVLTFVLISIIIVGTLDSVNIFGDDNQGGLVNLAVGIIVALIGVRFMPTNMWVSLTAPSSAFVATILVGAPFLALFFVTMKIKFNLARKLLWLFYLIFMSYLIFFPSNLSAGATTGLLTGENRFAYIYIIFLILGGVMLFFDTTVRKVWYGEQAKRDAIKELSDVNLVERRRLREEMRELQKIVADSHTPVADRVAAEKRIAKIKKIFQKIAE